MSEDDEETWEEVIVFVGPCTCDHEKEDHGWGSCGQGDCECESGWEE